jgi:hypothetical protein
VAKVVGRFRAGEIGHGERRGTEAKRLPELVLCETGKVEQEEEVGKVCALSVASPA